MLMYWQTIVGSGVKYISKVQLYRISIFTIQTIVQVRCKVHVHPKVHVYVAPLE